MDIGLEKNGFLHADDVVIPGVEVARRGRGGRGKGKQITELLKPGQEILVQAVKDPLKTKGPRLSMQLSIAGRLLVYVPDGEGVGVSRRLPDKERDRLRKAAAKIDLAERRRDHPHRRTGRQEGRLRARDQVPAQAARGAVQARRRDRGTGHGLPGGRPVGAGGPRHLLRAVRAGDRGRPQAAPPARVLLHPHRSRAARPAWSSTRASSRCSSATAPRRRSSRRSPAASTCPAAAT